MKKIFLLLLLPFVLHAQYNRDTINVAWKGDVYKYQVERYQMDYDNVYEFTLLGHYKMIPTHFYLYRRHTGEGPWKVDWLKYDNGFREFKEFKLAVIYFTRANFKVK